MPPRSRRCGEAGHVNNAGEPCRAWPLVGLTMCRRHAGGKSWESLRAQSALIKAVDDWGISQNEYVDPADTLLRLIAQSSRRVQRYADAIEAAIHAQQMAGRSPFDEDDTEVLPRDQIDDAIDGLDPAMKVFLAPEYVVAKSGERVYVGQQISALATLESDERNRLAGWCLKAVAAGLEERRVRLAEEQGLRLSAVIRLFVEQMELTVEQRERIPSALRAAVATVFGGNPAAIEGSLAGEP